MKTNVLCFFLSFLHNNTTVAIFYPNFLHMLGSLSWKNPKKKDEKEICMISVQYCINFCSILYILRLQTQSFILHSPIINLVNLTDITEKSIEIITSNRRNPCIVNWYAQLSPSIWRFWAMSVSDYKLLYINQFTCRFGVKRSSLLKFMIHLLP